MAELHVAPPSARLVLIGEVDVLTIGQVTAALDAAVVLGCTRVDVDVRRVDFAGLEVLAALVEVATVLGDRRGTLHLAGTRPIHERVLEVLGSPGALVLDQGASG